MSESENTEYTEEQKNKRRALRAPLIVEKIPCEDGYKTLFGYAKNISRGGLFITTVKPREPGETFLIELTLSTKPPCKIRCQCQVVWKHLFKRKDQQEPGMGLRFLDITEGDGDRIEAWIEAQATKFTG
jgi:Tfp pilus assembly protein PilZ